MLLEIKDLVAGYGNQDILHGVSIEVDKGEIVCIIGPNGAGKSTVLRTIYGLLKPRDGTILFRGDDIGGVVPHRLLRKGLSFVTQDKNVFPSLTVKENLAMGAYTRPDMAGEGIENVLYRFPSLKNKMNIRAGFLSGGERKMLAIGMGLMLEPEMILMDEPSMGLSPKFVDIVFNKIEEISSEGISILIVEQNAYKALRSSNRGYVLDLGANKFQGESVKLLDNPDIRKLYLGG
ncbi:MAG: ABC transporter ATP-binding protein [Methanosarcinaceae archaeon]